MMQVLDGYFLKTLEVSFHASLIIGALLILRPLLKHFLTARWIYALWFIVLARLLLIDLPSRPAYSLPDSPVIARAVNLSAPLLQPLAIPATSGLIPTPFAWTELVTSTWMIGLVAMLLLFAAGSFRWSRRVACGTEVSSKEMLDLLHDCLAEMKISRHVRMIQIAGSISPSITGLLRPTLILPEKFSQGFQKEELRWIILHELAHLKRGDLFVQLLCHLLQAIHWFNPLVWMAFACLRHDRELACDEYVLDHQANGASRDYGHTLIKVAEVYPRSSLAPGFLGISEDKTNLHERVEKISRHRRPATMWIVSGALLCLLLAFVFLTRQVAPPHQATAKMQVYKSIAYVPAEVEVIQSETVIVPAIQALGLDKVWAKRFGLNEDALTPAEIMDRVSKILTVKIRPDADDVVYVTVQGDNPQEAANIANAITKQYVDKRNTEMIQDVTKRIQRSYDNTITDWENKLTSSRANLEKVRQKAKNPPDEADAADLQAAQLQVDKQQAFLDQNKREMAQQIEDQIAQNAGVRILAPAY